MRVIRNAYRNVIGKYETKKPLGRCKHRQEDNIKTDLREMGSEAVGWTQLPRDKIQRWDLVNALMNHWTA
jgi:hypothetical protein